MANKSDKKTIFINGRFFTQPVTGVQRYAIELLDALDRFFAAHALDQQEIDLVCLVPPDCTQKLDYQKIKVRKVGRLTGNLWEQIELPRSTGGALLFSPANIAPFFHPFQVVTIHDASVYAFPQAYSLPFRTKYRVTYQRMARTARRIITVSEFSKMELMRWCKMRPDQFEVIPHGSEHLSVIAPDNTILERAGLTGKRFFLGVGSQSPHKNFHGLIEAFRKLNCQEAELVLVGGKFGKVFQTAEESLPEHTHHLGYVKDQELSALYQNAAGFVFPSLYEGFGIPVLEAMSAGCPVICSSTSSLPEVGGKAVLYCDPANPLDIAEKMSLLLNQETIRDALRQAGYQQVKKFSWENAAVKTWDLLRSLAV